LQIVFNKFYMVELKDLGVKLLFAVHVEIIQSSLFLPLLRNAHYMLYASYYVNRPTWRIGVWRINMFGRGVIRHTCCINIYTMRWHFSSPYPPGTIRTKPGHFCDPNAAFGTPGQTASNWDCPGKKPGRLVILRKIKIRDIREGEFILETLWSIRKGTVSSDPKANHANHYKWFVQ